jgi:hypothetical protein
MDTMNLKRRIMARIYLEYTKNILGEYPDFFMAIIFIIALFTMIPFKEVIADMPKENLPSALQFLENYFMNSSWIIQALVVGFLIRIIVSGIRSLLKNSGGIFEESPANG